MKKSVSAKNKPQKNKSRSGSLVSRIKKPDMDVVCIYVFTILAAFVFAQAFYHIVRYELSHAYTADAPLYWAVGRGMLNGLTPYSDMYENKPVGVFILSAISFFFTDSTIICNIVSIISAFIIAVIPSLFLLEKYRNGVKAAAANNKGKKIDTYDIFSFLAVLMCGTMLAVYSEMRSGGFQVEAIGAACSILYIYSARKLMTAEDKKTRIIRTIITAIYISFTVMMKEPFLLVATIGILLFTDDLRSLVRGVIIPDIIGGIGTLIFLGLTGVLKPYFSVYIKHMFDTRLGDDSSLYIRTGNLVMLEDDIKVFDNWLWIVLVASFVITLAAAYKKSEMGVMLHALKVIGAVYIASFCVGLGSQYYNHHFIFAVPVYSSFIMYSGEYLEQFKNKKKIYSSAILSCCVVLMAIVFFNSRTDYAGEYNDIYDSLNTKAKYVDDVCDFYDVDRYQYIGFNGETEFIGLTKHSPMGPAFAQDPDNFQTEDTWFFQQLKKQINNSDIVILNFYSTPALESYVKKILENEFTKEPPKENNLERPSDFYYTVYYRKGM